MTARRVRFLAVASVVSVMAVLGAPANPATAAATSGCVIDPDLPAQSQANSPYLGVGQPAGTSADDRDGRVRLLLTMTGSQTVVRQPAADRLPGGLFGAALALGDVNVDGCTEAVIGAPGGRGRTGAATAGVVYLLPGQNRGVATAGWVKLVPPSPQAGSEYGRALAMDSQPFADPAATSLWVGAPGLDVNGVRDAGGVYHYELDAAGVPHFKQLVTLATAGVPGNPRVGDRFGEVLSLVPQYGNVGGRQSLLVGVPRADVGGRPDAGAATLLQTNAAGMLSLAQTWTQDSRGVPGTAEAGDRFGAAVANGAVGAPGEDLGKRKDAGSVQLFTIGTLGKGLVPGRSLTQNTRKVPGKAETGDRFGAALASGTIFCQEAWDLAVGSPGEDLGRAADAGTVTLITVRSGDCKPRLIRQGRGPLRREVAEAGDRLGATVRTLPGNPDYDEDYFRRLVVGAPGEDLTGKPDAGNVSVLDLSFNGSRTAWTLPGPAGGSRYGQVLSSLTGQP